MRPTPRTTNALRQMQCFSDHPAVQCLGDLSGQLERELQEAVEALLWMVQDFGIQGGKSVDRARAFLEKVKA